MTEDLTSQVTGTETTFTVSAPFEPSTLAVYVDGIRMTADDDYTETSSTVFETTLAVPSGSSLLVDFDLLGGGLLTASGT
jgi:hypothetical protein